jgi:hypothetical protein
MVVQGVTAFVMEGGKGIHRAENMWLDAVTSSAYTALDKWAKFMNHSY